MKSWFRVPSALPPPTLSDLEEIWFLMDVSFLMFLGATVTCHKIPSPDLWVRSGRLYRTWRTCTGSWLPLHFRRMSGNPYSGECLALLKLTTISWNPCFSGIFRMLCGTVNAVFPFATACFFGFSFWRIFTAIWGRISFHSRYLRSLGHYLERKCCIWISASTIWQALFLALWPI